MLFTERRDWLYDPQVFGKKDTQTALRIHAEATRKHSARPPPTFMEVDKRNVVYDQLWHVPLDSRTHFSRTIPIPAINSFERPDWRLTKVGIVPQRKDKFTLSNLILQQVNYFPERGDMVFWNGYRYMIIKVVLEPQGYWQQTNVWLGLVVECVIPPEGDARPLVDLSSPPLAETAQTNPLPQV
jgi:hypothetical protein